MIHQQSLTVLLHQSLEMENLYANFRSGNSSLNANVGLSGLKLPLVILIFHLLRTNVKQQKNYGKMLAINS